MLACMRNALSVAIAIIIVATCLHGFAACRSNGADSADLHRVVYAGSAWYGHAPVWAGQHQGIFRRHGFAVDRRTFGGSADRINALVSDNAQFASLGEVAMLSAMAADRHGFYWIGSHNVAPGNEGLVGINIHAIADLKGKKIALYENTSVHLTVALLLRNAGLDIRTDVEVLNGPDSAVVDLVRSGEAAAGAIWEPFFSDLQQLPGAYLLGTDLDTSMYKKFKSMAGPDVLCASQEWVDADPQRAQRFFRAYFEAVAWCRDHPEELIEIVMTEVRKPRESVTAALRAFHWIDWQGQAVMLSDARLFGQAHEASQLLIDLGRIDKIPKYRDWTHAEWFWQEGN